MEDGLREERARDDSTRIDWRVTLVAMVGVARNYATEIEGRWRGEGSMEGEIVVVKVF